MPAVGTSTTSGRQHGDQRRSSTAPFQVVHRDAPGGVYNWSVALVGIDEEHTAHTCPLQRAFDVKLTKAQIKAFALPDVVAVISTTPDGERCRPTRRYTLTVDAWFQAGGH